MLERVWRKGKPPTLLVGMETGTAALENSVCVCGTSLQPCLTRGTLWTVARQAPLSMGFSRQEYQSGLPFPSPRDLPDPGIEPTSPALQADAFTTSISIGNSKFIFIKTYSLEIFLLSNQSKPWSEYILGIMEMATKELRGEKK